MPSNFNPWGTWAYQGLGQDVSWDPHGRVFRVQLIVQEDVGKSLVALRSDPSGLLLSFHRGRRPSNGCPPGRS